MISKKVRDLTGIRCGRLKVVEFFGTNTKTRGAIWRCVCDCGNFKNVSASSLSNGYTRSCGCLADESRKEKRVEVTRKQMPEYRVWQGMKLRCLNPAFFAYDRYGGRGIKICPEWEKSFERFRSDMGPRPDMNHTLERLDNNKGYYPGNCVWATRREQARNKANSVRVEFNGEIRSLSDWCESLDLKYSATYYWLKKGATLAQVVEMRRKGKRKIDMQSVTHPESYLYESPMATE